MGWPTDKELGSFLVSAKLCQSVPDSITGTMAAAVRAFEKHVGWSPFLTTPATSVQHDPPKDGILWLASGFVSVSSVVTGYSSTSDGTELTEGTDYVLLPRNADLRNYCYDRVDFFGARSGAPGSVLVTGVPGRMTDNDPELDDVKFWLLRGAAASVALESQGQEGPMQRLKQGPVEMEFSVEAGRSRIEQWTAGYESMVSRYQRIVV